MEWPRYTDEGNSCETNIWILLTRIVENQAQQGENIDINQRENRYYVFGIIKNDCQSKQYCQNFLRDTKNRIICKLSEKVGSEIRNTNLLNFTISCPTLSSWACYTVTH